MRLRRMVFIAAALLILGVWWIARITVMPLGGSGTMSFHISRGASANEIAAKLAEQKIIRSKFGFLLIVRASGNSAKLKPGAYRLSPSMSPLEIARIIRDGDVSAKWVTFPEGFTINQIAERLEKEGIADAERFEQIAKHAGHSFAGFSRPTSGLEGYLFPDTYLLSIESSEESIIEEMLGVFDRKVRRAFSDEILASGMSLHEIVTIASLIEREAKIPEDRQLISGVIRNRLKKNMRLEIDATVLYALGKHKDRVLYRDLEAASPYNTYRNAGLPPGPIANSGIECIKAALNPADVNYYYYVAKPDGSHIFSRTMEEHQAARQRARGRQ